MPSIQLILSRVAAERLPLGRCGVATEFCVGAIRGSVRLFGASGRHSGGTTRCLINKPTHKNLNRPFPFRPALIRGNRFWQPNTAMQPTCSVGAILLLGSILSTVASVRLVLFCRTRLMANRWAAKQLIALHTPVETRSSVQFPPN